MPTFVVGDIQGCFRSFLALLDKMGFDPRADRLWAVGDLVNGGPESLNVLRWFFEHQDRANTVLGNHDLHLLSRACDARSVRRHDTIEDVLNAPDGPQLLEWLRHRPLLHADAEWVLVHAGWHPALSFEALQKGAQEIERALQSPNWASFLRDLEAQKSVEMLQDAQTKMERAWWMLATLTRMRGCAVDGRLDFQHKGPPDAFKAPWKPWFEVAPWPRDERTIVCGHWAALGLFRQAGLFALDSGCVWGGKLTALRIEDEELFEIDTVESPDEIGRLEA